MHRAVFCTVLGILIAGGTLAAPKPFQVVSTVDAPTITGRPAQLDSSGKLLPWPMPRLLPDFIDYELENANPGADPPRDSEIRAYRARVGITRSTTSSKHLSAGKLGCGPAHFQGTAFGVFSSSLG